MAATLHNTIKFNLQTLQLVLKNSYLSDACYNCCQKVKMCVQTNLTASCNMLLIYTALQNRFPEMYPPTNSIRLTAFNLR